MQQLEQQLKQAFPLIKNKWNDDIIPKLMEYIKIPNKSPLFDPNWQQNGYMHAAMQLIVEWCRKQPIQNMAIELLEEPGHTPLLFIDIPGASDDCVLCYGHMDKQPEMQGWHADLGPWKPVLRDGKLYGRGGADDGYAIFAAITSIATLQQEKIPHARCQIIIEASEESDSTDLPFYLKKLNTKINNPSLIICLDSGAGNYQQLWSTTSLRGIVSGDLSIEILTEGVHSGYGSGVVPSVTMILRQLLERIEDKTTGEIILPEFKVNIPQQRAQQAQLVAEILESSFYQSIPFIEKAHPVKQNIKELILNRTWRAALSVTGINGFPLLQNAGNVTLPKLTLRLSMRTPPTCDIHKAQRALQQKLEQDPPFNAKITYQPLGEAAGWEAPQLSEWLQQANEKASMWFYNKPAAYMGEGGSIPFMGMLGEMFPKAQFLITGVLGPSSNAHGPNEFLHIDMVQRLTGCVAAVLALHYGRNSRA